jgi:hypothetical protein
MNGSAVGVTRAPAPSLPESHELTRPRRVRGFLAREPFLALLVAVEALVLCVRLPDYVHSDTWLAVVAGRLVAQQGLPHHETLTVWSDGRTWVDQQWLGQLAFYRLDALGGLRLVLLVHVLFLIAGFTLALVFARRSGGSARSVAIVGILALVVALPNSVARTQSFAFLFFVGLFWLLASDSRQRSKRTYLVVPLLVLWANVHGSVVLGVALVGMWALAELIRAGRRRDVWDRRIRAVALGVAAPLCLLVSPYGLDVVDYYHTVLSSSAFRDLVTEWHAPTFPAQLPFFILAVGGVWLVARKPRRLTLFEHLALICTLFAAFDAVRNLVWFALVALMVVPRALDDLWPTGDAPIRERLNIALSSAAIAVTVIALASVAGRAGSWYVTGYPEKAADAVSAVADREPATRVFASEEFADWVLWKVPSLSGRVAFDARFELLTADQLRNVVRFRQRYSADRLAPARGYSLLVLSPATDGRAIRALRRGGAEVLFRNPHVVVLQRHGRT